METIVHDADAPYHAHVYYTADTRAQAASLRDQLMSTMRRATNSGLLFVGQLRDHKVGPHPVPQFEVHFLRSALDSVVPVLRKSALTVLVHPLTLDDVADHTTLAQWIGDPIALDLAPLDPPGINQGIARFGQSDF
jgi:DOPA 4,5-dioxygenase